MTLQYLLLKLGQKFLQQRASLGAIRRYLAQQDHPLAPPPDGRQTRLGVIQLEGQLYTRAIDYVEHIYQLVHQAVQEGAQLIIFPEDTGSYPLAGLIPQIERLTSSREAAPAQAVQEGKAPVLTLFRLLAPAARAIYQTTFSTLARSFRVHILAGSTIALERNGRVFKEAHLYSPEGKLLLSQRKTHLFPTEAIWGLSAGSRIQVAHTPVGTLAAPICMDHTYFEPIRIAWLLGAEIIIDPAADAARYNFWLQSRGVWGRVQESPAYGVHALMVGKILGVEFGGRSGVYAPLEMTPARDGILAQAHSGDKEEILIAQVDLEALRQYRHEHRPRFNLDLYRRYIPTIYLQAQGRAGGRRKR